MGMSCKEPTCSWVGRRMLGARSLLRGSQQPILKPVIPGMTVWLPSAHTSVRSMGL